MKFEITVDATMKGSRGEWPDDHDEYVQGAKHYFVDGIEVPYQAFEAAVSAAGVSWFTKEPKAKGPS